MAAVADPEKMELNEEEDEETIEEEEEEEEEVFTVQVGTTYSCKRQDGTYHDAEVVKTRMNKRAGREEYFVHYVGLNCRKNEWVDKTRLMLIKAEVEEEEEEEEEVEDVEEEDKDDNAAIEMDEKTSETEEVSLNRESEVEDEPQSKKIKVEVHEAPANSSVPEDLAEELTCLLCNKLFNDPVVVECGHNFCRGCLEKAWQGDGSFICPDCMEVLSEKRYTSNRALNNLVKKTIGASAISTPAKGVGKPKAPENCLEHDERLKLFCKDDGDLGCVICRESLKHTSHNFLPILDAVGLYRNELTSLVSPLEKALEVAEKMATQQKEKIENHKTCMEEYQEHIESEFQKLHRLLKDREEELLAKLHEEGDSLMMEMEENMAKIKENIESIKESIKSANEKLTDTDSVAFLTDIKSFIKKCEEQQKEALSSENTIIDKELSQETYKAPIELSRFEEPKPTAVVPNVKQIWIVGNCVISRAAYEANNFSFGQNLGFEQEKVVIHWIGEDCMSWNDLLPILGQQFSVHGNPNVLIVHLGGSELGHVGEAEIISAVQQVLYAITSLFPKVQVLWSSILPRSEWMTSQLNIRRHSLNRSIAEVACLMRSRVIWHNKIEWNFRNPSRHLHEGLTNQEWSKFLARLIHYIELALSSLERS